MERVRFIERWTVVIVAVVWYILTMPWKDEEA